MCGITGWIDWNKDLRNVQSVLMDMTDTMISRGPDASGTWVSEHAALGHRRLIVVDPAGGGQPMVRFFRNELYVMLYNGELYNTEDLRSQLISCGHRFQSHSDTEVLFTAFLEWGEQCLNRLNGIFSFAVWNENKQQLFIARDRLGVKPLFYTIKGSSFLFASEIKALLANPEVEPVIDREGLAEIFAIGPARTPGHGVFKEIKELKPGDYLVFDRNGLKVKPYWRLESHEHPDDLETTVQKIRDLVIDAVTRQLVSDVPVCTFLSGGLDSSAISAIAAEAMNKNGDGPLHTYSVDYVDNDRYFQANDFQPNADGPWIKEVSKHVGTLHHNITIDSSLLADSLLDAMRARDLPGMADIDSSLYLFSAEIKKGATVALSGECADEVFGGYPWLRRKDTIEADTFPWSTQLQTRLNILSRETRQYIDAENYLADRYHQALEEVPHLAGENEYERRMREIFYLNLTRWMPTLLDRKDRMSMACSLEVRVPFCDHRIVEYVWNVPIEQKFVGDREKGLLRQALKGLLPQGVLERKKSPYPKTHHPLYFEKVRDWLFEILDDPDSPILPFINQQQIREMAAGDVRASARPWFGQLMGISQLFAYLIQVNAWLKEYRVSVQ